MSSFLRALVLLLLLVAASTPAKAVLVEDWQFGDSSGTLLEDTLNSGSPGSTSWGSGLAHTTDGLGNYVIDDAGSAFKNANIADVLSGQLYYRIDFAGWDLDNQAGFRNLLFSFRNETSTEDLLQLQLNQTGGGALRFRYSDNNGVSNQQILPTTGSLSTVETSSYSAVLGLDATSGNYNVSFDTGSGYQELVTGNLIPKAVEALRFAVNPQSGTDGFGTAGDFVNLDRIALSNDAADFGVASVAAIPEASAPLLLAAVGSLVGGAWFVRRHRVGKAVSA